MARPLSECNAARAIDVWAFAHPASVEREPKQGRSASFLGECDGCLQCCCAVRRIDGDPGLLETSPRHIVAGVRRAAIGSPIVLVYEPHAASTWTDNPCPRQALDQAGRAGDQAFYMSSIGDDARHNARRDHFSLKPGDREAQRESRDCASRTEWNDDAIRMRKLARVHLPRE